MGRHTLICEGCWLDIVPVRLGTYDTENKDFYCRCVDGRCLYDGEHRVPVEQRKWFWEQGGPIK